MRKILEGHFYLERFSGKGGWTCVPLKKQEFLRVKSFGMLQVSGELDGFQFEGKHLMPKGDGTLFLPVAKPIRQHIKKEAGDLVHLLLFVQEAPSTAPPELIQCLQDDPGKWEAFQQLDQSKQEEWVAHIYATSSLDSQTKRILKLLNSLETS